MTFGLRCRLILYLSEDLRIKLIIKSSIYLRSLLKSIQAQKFEIFDHLGTITAIEYFDSIFHHFEFIQGCSWFAHGI